jgi:hypothetical protein
MQLAISFVITVVTFAISEPKPPRSANSTLLYKLYMLDKHSAVAIRYSIHANEKSIDTCNSLIDRICQSDATDKLKQIAGLEESKQKLILATEMLKKDLIKLEQRILGSEKLYGFK